MSKILDKIFRSNITMVASLVAMIICWADVVLWFTLIRREVYPFIVPLMLLSTIYGCVIVFTYKTHDKNIMKPAIGMLMGTLVMYCFVNLCQNIMDPNIHIDYFTRGARGYVSFALDILQCVIYILFCFMHLAQNKTHGSSPKMVIINKSIVFSSIVILIAQIFLSYYRYHKEKAWYCTVLGIGLITLTLLISCLESKIDFFRAVREENNKE